MMNSIDSIENQRKLTWAIIALSSYNPIVSFVNTIFNLLIGEGFIYDTIVVYAILLYLIMRAVIIIIPVLNKETNVSFIVVSVILIFTILFNPENLNAAATEFTDFTSNPIYFFMYTIVAYFILRNISNLTILISFLLKISFVIILISIINFFLLTMNGLPTDYMVISYDSLFYVVFVSILSLERKNLLYGLFGIAGIVFIFTVGARGALISLLLSFFVYFIFKQHKLASKIIISNLLLLSIFLVSNYFEEIIFNYSNELESINFQSRTVNSLLDNSFMDDSGRGEIRNALMRDTNLIGNGLFGDRKLLNGAYAHNLFIEIVFQWGYILGIPLIILMIVLFLKGLVTQNRLKQILVIAFMSAGFFKLFFSGSYLTEVNFGVLLAVCINSFNDE